MHIIDAEHFGWLINFEIVFLIRCKFDRFDCNGLQMLKQRMINYRPNGYCNTNRIHGSAYSKFQRTVHAILVYSKFRNKGFDHFVHILEKKKTKFSRSWPLESNQISNYLKVMKSRFKPFNVMLTWQYNDEKLINWNDGKLENN